MRQILCVCVCVVTGGPWCRQHIGVDFDGIRAKARGGPPEAWCRRRRLPLSASFAFSAFGERGASCLVEAWAHRMAFVFAQERGAPLEAGPFRFSDEVVQSYEEVPGFDAFVRQLAPGAKAHQRARQIRALRPM